MLHIRQYDFTWGALICAAATCSTNKAHVWIETYFGARKVGNRNVKNKQDVRKGGEGERKDNGVEKG